MISNLNCINKLLHTPCYLRQTPPAHGFPYGFEFLIILQSYRLNVVGYGEVWLVFLVRQQQALPQDGGVPCREKCLHPHCGRGL